MATSTVGLVGHGMLLAPACPCRAARLDDLLVIGRGFTGPLVTEVLVKPGSATATTPPAPSGRDVSSLGPTARSYSLGPDAPELIIDGKDGAQLEQLLLAVDVGIADSEWNVLAPGFCFELPRGVVLFSPDPEVPGDLPELHLGTYLGAVILFQRAGRAAGDIVMTGPGGATLEMSHVETENGPGRVFHFAYEHEGARWMQQRYVLPYDDARSIVMMAQAPTERWPDLERAASHVAMTFARFG